VALTPFSFLYWLNKEVKTTFNDRSGLKAIIYQI
jgi:hypothetical protein